MWIGWFYSHQNHHTSNRILWLVQSFDNHRPRTYFCLNFTSINCENIFYFHVSGWGSTQYAMASAVAGGGLVGVWWAVEEHVRAPQRNKSIKNKIILLRILENDVDVSLGNWTIGSVWRTHATSSLVDWDFQPPRKIYRFEINF